MKDQLNINIRIAELPPIPMTVNPEDEEAIRNAQNSVNQVWKILAQRYPESSPAQLLALTALQFARRCALQQQNEADAADAVSTIDQALDGLLNLHV